MLIVKTAMADPLLADQCRCPPAKPRPEAERRAREFVGDANVGGARMFGATDASPRECFAPECLAPGMFGDMLNSAA